MQVVAKTPHISVRIEGEVPTRVLEALKAEIGEALQVHEGDEEYVDVLETDWYRELRLVPGEALAHYRKMHGMTQAQLGEKLQGVPRQHISNMESGTRAISLDMAKKLAVIFNTTPINFLDI